MIQPTRIPPFLQGLPLGRDAASVRIRVEAMERLLERAFTLPGINRGVGLDTIIGLVPIVGDAVATALGGWIVWEARNLGMSKLTLARMSANVDADFALGLVPFVGDVADYFFRSNTRNLRLIKRHLDNHHPATAIVKG